MPVTAQKTKPAPPEGKDIATILASLGVLSEDKGQAVKLEQVNTGRSLKEIILAHNFANEEQISKAEAQREFVA